MIFGIFIDQLDQLSQITQITGYWLLEITKISRIATHPLANSGHKLLIT